MLEVQVRQFYRALKHDGLWTQMHCQDVETGKLVGRDLIQGEEAFVTFCRAYNGKGNVFCGRNPRTKLGAVAKITSVTFDLDPADYDRKVGSTNEQIEQCVAAGRAILQRFQGGFLSFSGNGVLVGYVFDGLDESLVFPWPAAFKRFTEAHVEPILKNYTGVKLDGLFDNERLVKVMGTLSCRGQRRFAKFLVFPSGTNDRGGLFSGIKRIAEAVSGSQGSNQPQPNDGNLQRVGPASGVLDSNGSLGLGSADTRQEGGLIPHGQRHNALVRLSGALRRQGGSENSIFAALRAYCNEQCEDGKNVPDENLRRIARSVMPYEPAKVDYRELSKHADLGGNSNSGVVDVSVSTPADSLAAYEEILRKRSDRKEPKFPTGFQSIDDKTEGFTEGDLFVIGANTGAGKSTWCVNAADHLLKRGTKVLLLSTELTRYQIYDKVFSLNTGLEYKKFRRGDFTAGERAAIEGFKARFKEYPLVINDLLSPSIEQVREMVKREKPEVLMLDHIHQVGSGSNNLYGFLSKFTNDLKDVAETFKMPVVVAAQFSRPERMMDKETGDVKIARKPTVYDFKACGEIENRAATALLLYDTKESVDVNVNKVGADIAKCRHGERGFVEIGWKWRTNLMQEVG